MVGGGGNDEVVAERKEEVVALDVSNMQLMKDKR
jgi:hypothetical protein